MTEETKRNLLLLSAVLAIAVIVESFIITGGCQSLAMLQKGLFLLTATAVLQFATLMFILSGSAEEEEGKSKSKSKAKKK